MLTLWMFGSELESVWGTRQFTKFFFICGIGAGLISVALSRNSMVSIIGASGAIYGVILAYSLTWPDRTIMLIFPPVAFRAIWLIPALFFMSWIFDPGNVSHVGHLSGAAVGWVYLHSTGDARANLSWGAIKHRYRRWRMRQKLRAVQYEEWESKRRERDRRYH